jgi:hypothetical protein
MIHIPLNCGQDGLRGVICLEFIQADPQFCPLPENLGAESSGGRIHAYSLYLYRTR